MRTILAVLAIIAGLIGLGLAAYLYVSPGSSTATTPVESEAVSSSAPYFDLEVERPAPDFTLVNQDGEVVSLSDFRGSFVLLDFIYTSCRTVCPMLTANFRRIQDELGDRFGSGVFLISVTIDPEYDTPEVLKAYAETFGAGLSGWAFLTGEPETVYQMMDEYMQTFEEKAPRDIDHTALTVLINPAGEERHRYWGTGYPPQMVIERIEAVGRQRAEEVVSSAVARPVLAGGLAPDPAEMEALLGIPQGEYVSFASEKEAVLFVDALIEKLLAQGWTKALSRFGPEQEARFLRWGEESFIGIGRDRDKVVVLQDSDPVRLWTDFFEKYNLYCCG
ncbi:MAG: SCO family protein [Anaerolineae bacterium]